MMPVEAKNSKRSAASRGSSGDLVKIKDSLHRPPPSSAPQNTPLTTLESLTDCLLHLQLPAMSALLEKLNSHELTDQQFWVLTLLQETADGLSMGEIAKSIAQSTGATTSTVDGMEGLGVARRHLPKSDRRKVYAQITPKGEAILAEVKNFQSDILQRVFTLLNDQEASALINGAEKVFNQLKSTP